MTEELPKMSFCHRFKRFWNFYWQSAGVRKQDGAIVKATDCRLLNQGAVHSARQRPDTSCTDGRWVPCETPSFDSSQEMAELNSKMDEMWHLHKDELRQIREQHELLRTKRILLNRRVSELERMLQADQKIHTLTTSTMNCEELALASEDLELISQMEDVLQMLEKNQQELNHLEKCLEIELRERTLYPEPVILRTRTLEDEFSKRMRLDGGLKYEGRDKTVRCITHQCLPPPLSLSELYEGAAG